MEPRTATAPTSGTSPSASYADAIDRRAWAARSWVATGDTYYRGQAIAAHVEAATYPQHRP